MHIHIFTLTHPTAPCLELPFFPNGVITYAPDMTPDFEVDTVATHTCNDGYRLIGVDTRVCLAGGMWSGLPPACQGT